MENRKKLALNIFWTILYAIITLFLVLHHEIWADEAQVWLLSKNLSVFGLFEHLVQEGHPSFFYLLMMPFAKTGCSVFIMQIFCWLCACAAVFILLQFSPFSRFEKTSIILSSGFLYFFPVIARSYSMIPLLIFIAAILYKKQKEYPVFYAIILALIANTHIIMFMFSATLGGYFIYDNLIKEKQKNKKNIISAALVLLGLFAVILQLAATPFGKSCAIKYDLHNFVQNILSTFTQFFGFSFGASSAAMLMLLGGIFLTLLVYIFLKDKKLFSVALSGILFQLFIYITSYSLHIYGTKSFCALLIILFCFWQIEQGKYIKIILSIFFLMSTLYGLSFALSDVFNNYSSGKETAEYIRKNLPEDAVFIPIPEPYALSVMLYLPDRKFWSGTHSKYVNYMHWSCNAENNKSFVFDYRNVKEKNIYFIVSMPNPYIDKIFNGKIEVLFQSKPSIAEGESFRVIKYILNE